MEKNLSYYIKHPEKAMEISESEMKAWLEQYPYSAAVRMLRARKSLDGLAPASKDDIIRAADYVSDPLFLYYQLLKNEEKETETLEAIRNWKKEESGPSSVNKVLTDAAEEGPVVPDEPEQTASPPGAERKTGNKEEVPPEQKPEPRRSTRPQTKRSTSKSADKAQPKTTKKPSVIGPTPSREDRAAEQAKKQEVVKEALQAQKSGPLTFSSWLNSLEPVEGKEKPKTGAKSKKKKPKKSTKKRSRLDKLISQSIAEKEEAISETYADLLISQGYTEKAKEVLRKLLLKFPEKSGYFAAKIENLDKE